METHTLPRPIAPDAAIAWSHHHSLTVDTLVDRLAGRRSADPASLDAVNCLIAAADPGRADRLAPRPDESAVLVQRLALWALRRVDETVVARALALLHRPNTEWTVA